jgi:hypothetical protein
MNLLVFLAVGIMGFVAYDVWKKTNVSSKKKEVEEEDDWGFMQSGLFDSDCPTIANTCKMNKSS